MKTFVAIFVSLILMLIVNNSSAATNSTYTYEVETGDVGTIKVTASDKATAYRAAGNECFDRRVAMYERLRGEISEERMHEFAISCANLKW